VPITSVRIAISGVTMLHHVATAKGSDASTSSPSAARWFLGAKIKAAQIESPPRIPRRPDTPRASTPSRM